MKRFDVVGLGLNAVDWLVVVEKYPAFNTKIPLKSHRRSPGGQVATALTALARLGKSVAYVGKVGDDEAGAFQRASLERERVNIDHLNIAPEAETQCAYIIIEAESGERTIIWHHDRRLDFTPDEITEDMIVRGRVLHLDGHSVAACVKAAGIAREHRIPVVIDIDEVYDGVETLLPLVDHLIASTEFPALLTGVSNPESALADLHARFGCRTVAMTLGVEGSLALRDGKFIRTPAFRVPCRDTTGAGDAFRGGFLHGLLENVPIAETMRIANAVAALKCRALGARTALPTRTELDALLNGTCPEFHEEN